VNCLPFPVFFRGTKLLALVRARKSQRSRRPTMRRLVQISMLGLCSFLVVVVPALGQHLSGWSTPDNCEKIGGFVTANGRCNLGATVNSSTGDFFADISKDGRSLYFTSARTRPDKPTADWDIYVSKRECVTCPWGGPVPLGANINTSANEGAPFLSVDG